MEIKPSHKISAPECSERKYNPVKPSGIEFKNVFQKLIEDSNEVGTNGETASIEPMSTLPSVPFFQKARISAFAGAEKMLDILEEYQGKLANPTITLREIAPLIKKLETGKNSLISSVDSLSDDIELKKILNHVIITSSIEIIKFNRGDYVNA